MDERDSHADDEISLLDVYEFIKEGWRTLAAVTAFVGAAGLGTSFVLPEKFVASASIQPARVLGGDVETIAVLAEKMRSPTYYSPAAFAACGVNEAANPSQELTTALKPVVGRQSSFVGVSYKSGSAQQSVICLNAVLADVNRDQQDISSRQIELAVASLDKEKEKLKLAEDFLASISNRSLNFDFKDAQFSASSLLLATLMSKQGEITELKANIQRTQLLLTQPQTQPASFTTPIYAANTRTEPKRALIVAVSVLAGGLMGLLLLVLKKTVKRVNKQAQASRQKNLQTEA